MQILPNKKKKCKQVFAEEFVARHGEDIECSIEGDIKGLLQDGHLVINGVDPHKILILALPSTV